MNGIFVSVLVAAFLRNAIAIGDIQGYIKDLKDGVMQRFDGLEESNKELLKELHQVEETLGRTSTTDNKQDAACKDHSSACSTYAKKGYCKTKADQMLEKCPKSCNACGNMTTDNHINRRVKAISRSIWKTSKGSEDSSCNDHSPSCSKYANRGFCKIMGDRILKLCPKSCNACENATTSTLEQRKSTNETDASCKDHCHRCATYAKIGYCKTKADKILKKCPKSCNVCGNATNPIIELKKTRNGTDATCKDRSSTCSKYAKKGYCKTKADRMLERCPKSCNVCGNATNPIIELKKTRNGTDATCKDQSSTCSKYAKKGYCKTHADRMLERCPKSCNVCGNATTPTLEQGKSGNGTDATCKDQLSKCSKYAKKGYCETKADKMLEICPKSCNVCMKTTPQTLIQKTTNKSKVHQTTEKPHRRRVPSEFFRKRNLEKTRPLKREGHMSLDHHVSSAVRFQSNNSKLAKGRQHLTREALLFGEQADGSANTAAGYIKGRRRLTKEAFMADDSSGSSKHPMAKYIKGRRHLTKEAFTVDDSSGSSKHPMAKYIKGRQHLTKEAFTADDSSGSSKHPMAKYTKGRRHFASKAFMTDGGSGSSKQLMATHIKGRPHLTKEAFAADDSSASSLHLMTRRKMIDPVMKPRRNSDMEQRIIF